MILIVIDCYYKEIGLFVAKSDLNAFYYPAPGGPVIQHFVRPAPLSHKEVLKPHNGIEIFIIKFIRFPEKCHINRANTPRV